MCKVAKKEGELAEPRTAECGCGGAKIFSEQRQKKILVMET